MNARRLLITLGLLGLTVLVVSTFKHPQAIIHAFQQVRWYVVPLVVIAQAADYYCNAKYYQDFFAIGGRRIDLRRLYEASLGINFANQAIPSGGVAGTTYLAQAVKRYDVPSGQATLAQVGRYIFTFLSYFIVLAFGFLTLFFSHDLNKVSVRFVILLMILILAAGLVLLTLFSERSRLEAAMKPVIIFVNALGFRILGRRQPLVQTERIANFLTEFYQGYTEIMSHKGRWPALLWWSLAANMAEVATIYGVFIGFGQWVNPGVAITGYTLAIIASISGIIVGGLGVYEAGMIGTFTALGLPFALSLAVVLVYRVLNMGIFLPIGLHYYRLHLQETA